MFKKKKKKKKSTDEKLKVWHSHYKFLGSDSSGHIFFLKDYWKDF